MINLIYGKQQESEEQAKIILEGYRKVGTIALKEMYKTRILMLDSMYDVLFIENLDHKLTLEEISNWIDFLKLLTSDIVAITYRYDVIELFQDERGFTITKSEV